MKKIIGSPLIQIACLAALVLAGMLWPVGPWTSLENKNFDFWSGYFRSPDSPPISIVAIDAKSTDRLGDWPWPRSRLAEMVRLLSTHGATALGISLLYTQPDQSPGLEEIRALKETVVEPKWPGGKKAGQMVAGLLGEAENRLDQDTLLISAIRRARNRGPVPAAQP